MVIKSVDTKVLVKAPDVRSLQTKAEKGLLAHVQTVELVGLEVAYASNKWNVGDTVYFQASTVQAALNNPFVLGDQKVAVLEDSWVLAYKRAPNPGGVYGYGVPAVGHGGTGDFVGGSTIGPYVPFSKDEDGA